MSVAASPCVNPPLPCSYTARDEAREKPLSSLNFLLAALAMGIALKLFGPSGVRALFATLRPDSVSDISALFTAFGASIVLHEAGHLIAALLLDFEILGGSLGPFRATRLHGKWTLRFSKRAPACGSVSAIPRNNHSWRLRMLLVVAAGPAATLLTGIAAWSMLPDHAAHAWASAFLGALTQFSFFIFVLGLIPNRPTARTRNDANLFSSLWRNTPEAQEILLYHLITQMQIAGLRPRDYPEHIIHQIAAAQGRPEARLLYANTIVLWAIDGGDVATADAWDRRALELSECCELRLQNLTLAKSACFDVLFRKDLMAGKRKFEEVEFGTVTPDWFRHRAQAAQCIATGNVSGALAEIRRAESLFPKRLPCYEFEKMLLEVLQRLALEVQRTSTVL